MDINKNKFAFKAAFITGIANFIGFISIIFLLLAPMDKDISSWWKGLGYMLIYFVYFIFYGPTYVGILEAIATGVITFFIFKFAITREISRQKLRVFLIFGALLSVVIGVVSFSPIDRIVRELYHGKEHVGTVDTNRDGKPDKWVHYDIYDSHTETDYDSNLDGKPDIWEYYRKGQIIKKADGTSDYKVGQVYKRSIDTDFDGKPDKTELINDAKKK